MVMIPGDIVKVGEDNNLDDELLYEYMVSNDTDTTSVHIVPANEKVQSWTLMNIWREKSNIFFFSLYWWLQAPLPAYEVEADDKVQGANDF